MSSSRRWAATRVERLLVLLVCMVPAASDSSNGVPCEREPKDARLYPCPPCHPSRGRVSTAQDQPLEIPVRSADYSVAVLCLLCVPSHHLPDCLVLDPSVLGAVKASSPPNTLP